MTEFLYSALEGGFSINSFCFLRVIPFTRVWGYDVSSCEHTILWTTDFEQNEDLIYQTLSATKPFRPSFYRLCLSKEDNTSRFIYINQDLFIYIKIYLYKSRFIYIHQDLFTYIKIHSPISRFIYIYQDSMIWWRNEFEMVQIEDCDLDGYAPGRLLSRRVLAWLGS